ncbi:tRNA (guanosine(37)-N1)-methyltransferase TrmD [bacterium]|nr:tRNA (guanosine(37)-N1)-methyltransferase TrmD [bacterium]
MTNFNIITIFPKIFESYFSESIIKRAQDEKKIRINAHNLRDWTEDKYKTVDDTPYGGGAGMVLKVEPIYKAVKFVKSIKDVKNNKTSRVILFSAKGKRYAQSDAERLSKYDNLILICGRYEGVDERVAEHIADEEISIGDYVLTGGEIPAMILVDSITRLLPGVLGNPRSLKEESFKSVENVQDVQSVENYKNDYLEQLKQAKRLNNLNILREYPQYTKPENFRGWKAPKVLLSGNHKEIEKWRKENRGK